MLWKGEPPTCVVPLCQALAWHSPLCGALNDKEFRALRGATADRGGSDKPLERLERNFQ